MTLLDYGTNLISGSVVTSETKRARDPRPVKEALDQIFNLLSTMIDSQNLAEDAITSVGAELAANAVTAQKYADGAVTVAKITNIGAQKLQNGHIFRYEESAAFVGKGNPPITISHNLGITNPCVLVEVTGGSTIFPTGQVPYWIRYINENQVEIGDGDGLLNMSFIVRVV